MPTNGQHYTVKRKRTKSLKERSFKPDTLYLGDCRDILPSLPDECIDLIVQASRESIKMRRVTGKQALRIQENASNSWSRGSNSLS